MERHASYRNEAPSSPNLKAAGTRASPSPSRPHHLNALSPLQAFSPLQSAYKEPKPTHLSQSVPSPGSEAGDLGGRSRSSSVTRSLSRKQSVYRAAEQWSAGHDYVDENLTNPMSLFSRLTLVKAPAEKEGLRRRSKSSSSLAAPFAAMSSLQDIPATSSRAPRRSFVNSFGGISAMQPIRAGSHSTHSGAADAVNRISQIYSPENNNDGVVSKSFTPAEVVEIARGLSSPVMMPEGGLKRADLKRRKSAGASTRRSSGVMTAATSPDDNKEPLALEPVEYVQLDDETLLPFVDRADEVADLIRHPSNDKMFKTLKAAFPKTPARKNWQEISPEEWSWDEFVLHLTGTDRFECPDYAWVFRARRAVRQRSVALWEKVGVCLGCDGDLLNAGGEDGIPNSWGGLGLGEEGEYDPTRNQVWIEGLEAVDPADAAQAERAFEGAFGQVVEDEGEQASAGMTALLGTIGEGEEEAPKPSGRPMPARLTTAQRAGRGEIPPDPMNHSPTSPRDKYASPFLPSPTSPTHAQKASRSKSFVGLTIMTAPGGQSKRGSMHMGKSPSGSGPIGMGINLGGHANPGFGPDSPSPRMSQLGLESDHMLVDERDRGPGSPLFPTSFSTLSMEPNLGRKASALVGGVKPMAVHEDFGRVGRRWSELRRKPSGAGLSESAITFASESEYTPSAPSDHHAEHGDHE